MFNRDKKGGDPTFIWLKPCWYAAFIVPQAKAVGLLDHFVALFRIYSLVSFFLLAFFSISSVTLAQKARNMAVTQTVFGKLPDGTTADLFTLRNKNGMEARITNYGGIITHLFTPDRNGQMGDVVLGFDSLSRYVKGNPFFGALVGRYGNRIANAKFTLDGQTYALAANNGANSLHGGLKGFDKVLWKADVIEGQTAIRLQYLSKDGEEGFPGNLNTEVIYRLTDDNALEIEYKATTDKPTIVNLTNHSYFNLSAGKVADVLGHEGKFEADKLVEADKTLVPTGALIPVKGTAFDFSQLTPFGTRIDDPNDAQIKIGGGYDHTLVVNGPAGTLNQAATVYEPVSGRVMMVKTTEPGFQFYTANFLRGPMQGKNGQQYGKRGGFCIETQHYPDSPNQPSFPSAVLRPGQAYFTKTVFQFSIK
jgi:aldose 1-epimerase